MEIQSNDAFISTYEAEWSHNLGPCSRAEVLSTLERLGFEWRLPSETDFKLLDKNLKITGTYWIREMPPAQAFTDSPGDKPTVNLAIFDTVAKNKQGTTAASKYALRLIRTHATGMRKSAINPRLKNLFAQTAAA